MIMEKIKKPTNLRGLYIVFFISFHIALSLSLSAQSNLLMPTEQIVSYSVDFYPDMYNLSNLWTARENAQNNSPYLFYTVLKEGVLSGDLELYSPHDRNYDLITAEIFYDKPVKYIPIKHSELFTNFGSWQRVEIAPGIYKDSLIANENELVGTFFIESWYLDAEANKFEKNIKCILPVFCFDKNGDNWYFRPCVIPFDYTPKEIKRIRKNAQFSNRISYIYFFDKESDYEWYKSNSPLLTNFVRNELIDYIFNLAKSREIIPRDFYTKEPLTAEELTGRLHKEEVINIEISRGVYLDTTITVSYQNNEIKSLVFIEDWYVSKDPFMVFKDVVGIAPVRTKRSGLVSILGKGEFEEQKSTTIPFVIYFNKNKIDY